MPLTEQDKEYTPPQREYHQLCSSCKHRKVMHVNNRFIHDGECSVSGCRCPEFTENGDETA